MSLIIGVDPDSAGFPVAIYRDGKLESLEVLGAVQFCELFREPETRPDVLVIEDVASQTFRYSRTDGRFRGKSLQEAVAISFKMGQGLGKCMHGQIVAVEIAEHYGVPVIPVKPTAANWANNKPLFEAATGWKGRSNGDTRSAAYFGFIHKDFGLSNPSN